MSFHFSEFNRSEHNFSDSQHDREKMEFFTLRLRDEISRDPGAPPLTGFAIAIAFGLWFWIGLYLYVQTFF